MMEYSIISNRAVTQTAMGITPFDMKVMTRQLEDGDSCGASGNWRTGF